MGMRIIRGCVAGDIGIAGAVYYKSPRYSVAGRPNISGVHNRSGAGFISIQLGKEPGAIISRRQVGSTTPGVLGRHGFDVVPVIQK